MLIRAIVPKSLWFVKHFAELQGLLEVGQLWGLTNAAPMCIMYIGAVNIGGLLR